VNESHEKFIALRKKVTYRLASAVINYRLTTGALTNNQLEITCEGLDEPYGPIICANFEPVLRSKGSRLFGRQIEVKTLFNCPAEDVINDPLLKKIATTLTLRSAIK